MVHSQITMTPPSSLSHYDMGSSSPAPDTNETVIGVPLRDLTSEEESDVRENSTSKDLPEELTSQFSARHCELCVVQMNSELQSRMHYNGKQHQKKVRLFMNSWIRDHGSKQQKKMRKESVDDKRLYCECCDLSFTSLLHAQQHYRGRNHQRVLSGQEPLKSGYFNKSTNRWQRYPPMDSTGRSFGNMKPHEPFTSSVSCSSLKPNASLHENSSERLEEHDFRKGRFFCELCNIGATSQEQLDMHILGGKHKKVERALQQIDVMEDGEGGGSTARPADSILASVTSEGTSRKKSRKRDYSIYRTPSGKFYCHQCNLTVPCESQFIQHLDSRRHKIMTGPKKSSVNQNYPSHGKYAPATSSAMSTISNTSTSC